MDQGSDTLEQSGSSQGAAAKLHANGTTAATGAERALVIVFLLMLFAVPTTQLIIELRRGESPQALDLFRQKPTAKNLRAYERDLEDSSRAAGWLRPLWQFFQFAVLNDGGEKALLGKDGWVYFGPGVRYMYERGVTHPDTGTPEQTVRVIRQFRDDLARKGIHLLIVVAPNKESIYPEMLMARGWNSTDPISATTRSVLDELESAQIDVVNLFELFYQAKSRGGPPLYLKQDSHWSPIGMALAAESTANRIRQWNELAAGTEDFVGHSVLVERTGDILRMLQVPALERHMGTEQVNCAQVVSRASGRGRLYHDVPNSEVLVLGDSFLRVYETDEPGSAGFLAHLAKQLRRSVTSLVSDGGGSTQVREELARRPELLNGRKVVVWELVERDLLNVKAVK